MISNQTRAARSFELRVWFQTKFHSTQFNYYYISLVWNKPNLKNTYSKSVHCSVRISLLQQNDFTWVEVISGEPNVVVRTNIISIRCKSQHFGLFETWASSYWIHLNTIPLKPLCCGYYVSLSRARHLRRCNYYQKYLQGNKYSITSLLSIICTFCKYERLTPYNYFTRQNCYTSNDRKHIRSICDFYSRFSLFMWSTPKIVTIEKIKSRIWDMIDDQYINNRAKI